MSDIQPVSKATAERILALYAQAISTRTGEHCPTGIDAYRSGYGPALMDPAESDTCGNGHWTIIMEGGPIEEIADYSLQVAVQAAADAEGLEVHIEPYASWAQQVFPK